MMLSENRWSLARKELVRDLSSRGISDKRVIKAMGKAKREMLVSEDLKEMAYVDEPLPIGDGQTISQPYVVALMTELLLGKRLRRVLEIGTGSGYQTAVLGEIFEQVYSVERIARLLWRTKERLGRLGYKNLHLMVGDGAQGWPDWELVTEGRGFDGIIVTAAGRIIPEKLKIQLADDGKLVMPVGREDGQCLVRLIRMGNHFKEENFGSVSFVPLV